MKRTLFLISIMFIACVCSGQIDTASNKIISIDDGTTLTLLHGPSNTKLEFVDVSDTLIRSILDTVGISLDTIYRDTIAPEIDTVFEVVSRDTVIIERIRRKKQYRQSLRELRKARQNILRGLNKEVAIEQRFINQLEKEINTPFRHFIDQTEGPDRSILLLIYQSEADLVDKVKNKEDMQDIALALNLPTGGSKQAIATRIWNYLNE